MLKRIIFDLDNTLIMWKDEYIIGVKEAAKRSNVKINCEQVDEVIDATDTRHKKISKKKLLHDINKLCNLNLKMDFVDNLINIQKTFAEPNEEIIKTIEYLSKKYELVVLTNYFTEVQKGRLEKARILKYFKDVYGGDIYTKPNPRSYKNACGKHKKEECLMVGDSYKYDIEGSLKFGLKVIGVETKKLPDSDKYKKIKDVTELSKIL